MIQGHRLKCCRLPSANDYTFRLQDVTTIELVLLVCQLKIIGIVLQLQRNN